MADEAEHDDGREHGDGRERGPSHRARRATRRQRRDEPLPPPLRGAALRPEVSRGALLGAYRVLGELGRGGMGVVLQAQAPDGAPVAIKRLLRTDATEMQRFLREARLGARLDHPGIARLRELVTEGPDAPFLVFEYVPGQTLKELILGRRCATRVLVGYLAEVADAVAHAHERGVIHRDLKPQNILIRPPDPRAPACVTRHPAGAAVVLDFGIGKSSGGESESLTKTGTILGTLEYMSPEQAEGHTQASPAADIYALGAILYECLTGRPPFEGTVASILKAILLEPPRPPAAIVPSVDAGLAALAVRCLEKAPEARVESAAAFAAALRGALAGDVGEAPPPPPPRPPRRLWRRLPQALLRRTVLGAALGLGAALLLALLWRPWAAAAPPAPAEAEAGGAAALPSRTEIYAAALALGRSQMEARDLEGARACFGRAAANAATDEEAAVAYKERGVAAHRLGDLEAAIADYTRALGRRSDFAMVYNNRGAAYLERGEYERARADCTAALNLAGAGRGAEGAGEARQILIFSYSNRGEALLALGRDAEAEADYAAAIALDAASGDAFLGRALARASGGDAPGALADLRRARELLPEDPLVAFHCARLHYDAGHLDEAAALLDESLGRLPDARAYRLRGRVRERQGDLRAAAEDYERALCFDPRMEGAEEMRRFIAAHLRPGG